MLVNLRTDDRVSDVVECFRNASGWSIVRAIDSVNFGEGYELEHRGTTVILYDDVRSDEVHRRLHGVIRPEFWEAEFPNVVADMRGEIDLTFDVDRWQRSSTTSQRDTVHTLAQVLRKAGYASEAIRVEP